MELITLSLFCLCLLVCIALGRSILYALAIGLVLFLLYGRRQGFSWRSLGEMSLKGIRSVKNILITFVLIGMLTALWREAGTIPYLVSSLTTLIRPSIFLLLIFLFNCLISLLTGTAFGTAATMGVICSTIASSMGLDPVWVGGAVLSGVFFGDRCSPVSTSALLVAQLTETDIFDNIRGMLRTALVPFLATCAIYLAKGLGSPQQGDLPNLQALFAREFHLHWLALAPALVILVLALARVDVRLSMGLSILSALPICLLLQGTPVRQLPRLLWWGYQAQDGEVGAMLNGGGIWSMATVASIVCLSSAYSGIFQKTGLLNSIQTGIGRLSARTTPFAATLVTSILAGMVSCNQALTVLLTNQLCQPLEPHHNRFAITLEDTAVVVAPLVPWSIAGAVPLASVSAPTQSLLCAFFLILLPLWRLLCSLAGRARTPHS